MSSQTINSSLNLLSLVRAETDAIGVSLSFGKDSLAVLDLASKIFPRVEAFYLFRVANLSLVERWSFRVRHRYGISVHMYPHFDLYRLYRHAILQPHWDGTEKTPRITMLDIENFFRNEVRVDWIAYGWRRSDSRSRALIMKQNGGYDPKARRVFPLRIWRRLDVLRYLHANRIPVPDSLGRKEQGGLDFDPGSLSIIKQTRSDWEKWLTDFPFAETMLATQNKTPQAFHDKESDSETSVVIGEANSMAPLQKDPKAPTGRLHQ